jgi:hypothetical protein
MVKKGEETQGSGIRWFVLLVILAVVFYLVWLMFFSYKECDSWDCFNSRLEDCKRTTFIGGTNMIFEYTVKGEDNDLCVVGVELLQGEVNNKDSDKLVGQSMDCSLPFGVIMKPESDILKCHGLLKEGLQDLVINKLHTYIVENLGRINLEVMEAPTSSQKTTGGY